MAPESSAPIPDAYMAMVCAVGRYASLRSKNGYLGASKCVSNRQHDLLSLQRPHSFVSPHALSSVDPPPKVPPTVNKTDTTEIYLTLNEKYWSGSILLLLSNPSPGYRQLQMSSTSGMAEICWCPRAGPG